MEDMSLEEQFEMNVDKKRIAKKVFIAELIAKERKKNYAKQKINIANTPRRMQVGSSKFAGIVRPDFRLNRSRKFWIHRKAIWHRLWRSAWAS